MFTISKDFTFAASHQLAHLGEQHKCARLHGHNYVVRVAVSSPVLDERGMVLDYADLAPLGDHLSEHLDHRHLNDVVRCHPTAENLAQYLYGVAAAVLNLPAGARLVVSVSETPRTWATFTWEPA